MNYSETSTSRRYYRATNKCVSFVLVFLLSSIAWADAKVDSLDYFEEAIKNLKPGALINVKNQFLLTSKSNQLKTVSAAWFIGPGVSKTEAIQKAINCQQPVDDQPNYVIIPWLDEDWEMEDQVSINNIKNKVIVLEKGVVLTAAPKAFPAILNDAAPTLSMLRIGKACERIVICGQRTSDPFLRAKLIMFPDQDRDDRWKIRSGSVGKHRDSGRRSGVTIAGSSQFIRICGFDISNCCGDGILLNGATSVCVDDMRVRGNLRNNMSITSANIVRVTDSEFHDGYQWWSAGLDVEPDPKELVRDVIVQDCKFDNNPLGGITVGWEYPPDVEETRKLIEFRFERCVIRSLIGNSPQANPPFNGTRNTYAGVAVGPIASNLPLTISFSKVEVRGALGTAFYITGPVSENGRIELDSCRHQEAEGIKPKVTDFGGRYQFIKSPSSFAVNGAPNQYRQDREGGPILKDPHSVKTTIEIQNFKHVGPARSLLESCNCKEDSTMVIINNNAYALQE